MTEVSVSPSVSSNAGVANDGESLTGCSNCCWLGMLVKEGGTVLQETRNVGTTVSLPKQFFSVHTTYRATFSHLFCAR